LVVETKVAMATFLTEHLKVLKSLVTNKVHQMSDIYQRLQRNDKTKSQVPAIRFVQGNAESTEFPNQSFDLVTVMWAFHEAPQEGRAKIIQEARRLLSPGGVLAIIDIAAEYVPSKSMLKGEPYVQEYQRNIHQQLQSIQGFQASEYRAVIPNHLGMWTLTRSLLAA
jgi:ubiquinone/menaquinone biosynthesis C-methylase UbiE